MKQLKDLKFTDLRGTKVYVDTLEYSVLLQKMLFAMGGMWADGTTGLDDNFDSPRMYVISEDLLFTYTKGYHSSRNREVFISDILGEVHTSDSYDTPFEKGTIVLVRDNDNSRWLLDRFIWKENDIYVCVFGSYKQCIRYKGNGNLINTYKQPNLKQ